MDYFTHHPTITIFKPIITPEGKLKGSSPFISISPPWVRAAPDGGARTGGIFVVQRDGKVVLHSDPGALFKPFVRDELMDKMTSGEGQLYDPGATPVLLLLLYQSRLVCDFPCR